MMYSLNCKIFVLFVRFRRLEMKEVHQSFRKLIEANFCFKFVVLGRKCGSRSGTWQQTRHATKQASGNFLIPVGNKKKINKYCSFSASKNAQKVCIIIGIS